MKLELKPISILIFFDLLICLCLYLWDITEFEAMSILSIITIILVIFSISKTDKKRFTYTSALMVYTLCTQFGLVVPYYILGREILSQYHDYTLSFLEYSELGKAMLLGNIAVLTFELFKRISKKKYQRYLNFSQYEGYSSINYKSYIIGLCSLLIVLLYFVYHILFGSLRLISTYEIFMNSSAYRSPFYSYILILFYVGSIYLAAAGKIKEHKLGWSLWLVLVLIFAMNGNKGEFLYALLAILGLKGVQGLKITIKTIIVAALLVFLVIPSITSLRDIGIINNLNDIQINFFDAFAEMGMQIRTSVYVLNDLNEHKYTFLLGKSYYQPIINMLTPFLSHTTATQHIREMYVGYGFNQVIESYLNLGLLGVMTFFGFLGYILTKWENTIYDGLRLAYIGTITCILINATRNYFAFVPGQLVIVTVIYLFARIVRINSSQKNIKIEREDYEK